MYENLRSKKIQKPKPKDSMRIPKYIAVWIDHKQAEIFIVEENRIEKTIIESEIPKKRRSTGGSHASQPFQEYSLSSEHNEHRWRETALKKYFDKIMDTVQGASRLVVMGPGQTKRGLFHAIQQHRTLALSLDSEPVTLAHMTEAQKEKFVEEYFRNV